LIYSSAISAVGAFSATSLCEVQPVLYFSKYIKYGKPAHNEVAEKVPPADIADI
jgi:hypothetical protein